MLLIFDANALIHRLFHALPLLKDRQGRTTNALYGLTNILLKILKDFQPQYGVACYDRPEPTFRHQVLPTYKAKRPKVPSELVFQINQSKQFFEVFGFRTLEKSGYEADDLIGSLVNKFKDQVEKIIIVTGDLDTLQLVDNEKVVVWTMKKGISEMIIYDEKEVIKKYNLLPYQLPDYKALVGDPSDNIEGIKGIGPKSASNLIKIYGSLEKIIEAAKKGFLDEKTRTKLIENEDIVFLYKDLVTIKKDLKLDIELTDLKILPINYHQLSNLLYEFEFKSILKRLNIESISPEIQIIDFQNLPSAEKIYFLIKDNQIYFYQDEKKVGVMNIHNLPLIGMFKKEMIVFESKPIFKTHLKNHVKDYFDLKTSLWLTNPDLKKITPQVLAELTLNMSLDKQEYNVVFFPAIEKEIKRKLKDMDLEKIWEFIEKPLLPLLARIENWGIKVNQEKLKNKLIYFKNQKAIFEKKINLLTGIKINLNSWEQINWLLFEKLKIKPPSTIKKTKKGLISTSKKLLQTLKGEHPVIELILKYRQYHKLVSGYLENLVGYERVKTTFDQTLSATGRIISVNPSFLNFPRQEPDVLEIIEPENGFFFLSFDYSQMEFLIAGYLAGEEKIVSSILNGVDFHALVAKEIFNDESLRSLAKSLNFGILYGMGVKSLAQLSGFDHHKAKEYLENYFLRFPRLAKFLNDLKEKARIYGYTENILGRKRFLPQINSENIRERSRAERLALNTPIQSLAADVLKLALINLKDMINDDLRIIIPWYDEIIFEVNQKQKKDELINALKERLEYIFQPQLNFELKLKVKVKEGKNLAELK